MTTCTLSYWILGTAAYPLWKDLAPLIRLIKNVDNAIFVSGARQSTNKFVLCARLAKRWLCYLRFLRSAKYKQVCPLRSLSETLAILPSFPALGKVQTSLSSALA